MPPHSFLSLSLSLFFFFSRVQTGSAFFVSLSISPSWVIAFRLTFGFGYKFYEWMPFALKLYYFFSKGNFRLVSSLFKVLQLDSIKPL
jgi:hypothetical protein